MAFGISAGAIFSAVAPTVIGSLFGGGSDAPKQGADQQVQANNAAIAEQRAAAAQQRSDLAPWAQSGGGANTELMRRLGIGGNGRINSYTPKTMNQLRSEMRGQFTSQGGGGGMQYTMERNGFEGNYNPATGFIDKPTYYKQGQERPANDDGRGTYQMKDMGAANRDSETGSYYGNAPELVYRANMGQFDEAGFNKAVQSAFDAQGAAREGEIDPEYGSLLKAAPAYKRFSEDDLANDLVYQNGLKFGRETGENQINDRAASGGNYGSGAALKALTRFGNDYGTTKTEGAYNRNFGQQSDAYNRNMAGKNQMYGFLTGQSQQGQSAAAGQGAAGLGAAGQIGSYQAGNGNAMSAGTIGSANAMNQQVGQATDAYRWNQILNRGGGGSSYDTPRSNDNFGVTNNTYDGLPTRGGY